MKFLETTLKNAFVIEYEPKQDDRGFFARTWCEKEFKEHGLVTRFVQSNISASQKKGTLRGMHYQVAPHAEVKLIRCTRGAIYDVIIDLRPDSPTFKQWIGEVISRENYKMFYVPEGFAHGFQTLEDNTEVAYQVSEYYAPDSEEGIRWNDSTFGISWPISNGLIVSPKDSAWPDFKISNS